jgi:16S rRNA (uracil1498-N3)-methyltransferase
MAAPRFMSPTPLTPDLVGHTLDLDPASAHHATRVLRLSVGDALTLFDGTGGEYAATLIRIDKRGAAVKVQRFVPVERESPLALTLAQGIAASDAMDSAIRKATEVGVTAIQPLVTARSAPLPAGERGDKRLAHWRQVAVAASEQSGRNRVPEIAPPLALGDWLAAWSGAGIVFLPDADRTIAAIGAPEARLAVLIGPEGGFDERECAAARARGFHALRLGPRVLRADTAAATALAVVQSTWGDWR